MTDMITTHPITIHQPSPVRLQFPNLGIGQACESMCLAIMQAFTMAYVPPFSAMQRKPSVVFDEDIEGRDHDW